MCLCMFAHACVLMCVCSCVSVRVSVWGLKACSLFGDYTQVCYVRKQGGLFMYRTIVYIAITLFTLEGISRNGHMKSPTKRLEQKFDPTKAFSKASFNR